MTVSYTHLDVYKRQGPARAQNFPGTVGDAALQFGFRFPGDCFREGPNAVGNQVEGIDDMPVSYTHLDVYKRQYKFHPPSSAIGSLLIHLPSAGL